MGMGGGSPTRDMRGILKPEWLCQTCLGLPHFQVYLSWQGWEAPLGMSQQLFSSTGSLARDKRNFILPLSPYNLRPAPQGELGITL